jgi:hypothetical protein
VNARVKRTAHAVTGGYLGQLDLPHHPGFLKAVRTVEANVPRITRGWLIVHGPVTFSVTLPADLAPGMVVEWADAPDQVLADCTYTVVTAMSATSVTFAHYGRDADGALAAAVAGNGLREKVSAALSEHLRTTQRHVPYLLGADLGRMTLAELIQFHDDMPVTVASCRDCPSKYR